MFFKVMVALRVPYSAVQQYLGDKYVIYKSRIYLCLLFRDYPI